LEQQGERGGAVSVDAANQLPQILFKVTKFALLFLGNDAEVEDSVALVGISQQLLLHHLHWSVMLVIDFLHVHVPALVSALFLLQLNCHH
jgi:hypothetical protein